MSKCELDFIDEHYVDKDFSMLDKLTLVIPTYNRNYYLSRCLWYHAHFPFGQIIVADSSQEEKKIVNRKTVEKVQEMFGADILYLEYEPETEIYGGDIYQKWGDAVMHVETEYSQICTDKEFIFPHSSSIGIEFLDNNLDYGSYEGYYVDVDLKGNLLSPQKVHTERKSISDTDAYLRLLHGISHSFSSINLFAVKRTNVQKEIFSSIISGDINDIRFGEASIELLTLVSAKYYYDDTQPQKYRDITQSTRHGRKIFSESSDSRYPYINQYITDGTYDHLFKCFSTCLDKFLAGSSRNCPDINTLEWIITPYLERRCLYLSSYQQLLKKYNWVLRLMPIFVWRLLLSMIVRVNQPTGLNTGVPEQLVLDLIHKETKRDALKKRDLDLLFSW